MSENEKHVPILRFEEAKQIYSKGSHKPVEWVCPTCAVTFIKSFKTAFKSKLCKKCNNRAHHPVFFGSTNAMYGKKAIKKPKPECVDCGTLISSRKAVRCFACSGKLRSKSKQSREARLIKRRARQRRVKLQMSLTQYAAERDRNNNRRRKRLKTDQQYKLAYYLRGRINRAIKKEYRAGSAVDDLGCSIAEFKSYIEDRFKGPMTWENWGSVWQLDHVVPLTHFDLSNRESFLKAAHFTNLQPMLKENNHRKGNTLPTVYFLFGCFGSGKTTLTNSLKDKFHIYSYDEHRAHPMISLLNPPDFSKPLLYESPVLVSSFFKLAKGKLNVVPVYLKLSVKEIADNLASRGKRVDLTRIERRIRRLDKLAERFNAVSVQEFLTLITNA